MSDARQTILPERLVRITYLFNAQAVTITYHKLGEATRLRNHRCPVEESGLAARSSNGCPYLWFLGPESKRFPSVRGYLCATGWRQLASGARNHRLVMSTRKPDPDERLYHRSSQSVEIGHESELKTVTNFTSLYEDSFRIPRRRTRQAKGNVTARETERGWTPLVSRATELKLALSASGSAVGQAQGSCPAQRVCADSVAMIAFAHFERPHLGDPIARSGREADSSTPLSGAGSVQSPPSRIASPTDASWPLAADHVLYPFFRGERQPVPRLTRSETCDSEVIR